jgi:formate hydrogenlyase subunit 6/NADH:ubiquinone oxidoreductase subunit I
MSFFCSIVCPVSALLSENRNRTDKRTERGQQKQERQYNINKRDNIRERGQTIEQKHDRQ